MIFMLAGESFTGKSVSAGTFPKPMCYLEFDVNGTESLKHTRNKSGNLVVPDWNKIYVKTLCKQKVHDLSFITDMGGKASKGEPPEHTAESVEVIREYNEYMKVLRENKDGFQSLVIDSITSMFRLWAEMVLWVNKIPSLRQNDFGTLTGILAGQFFPNLRTLPIPYIILVNHVATEVEEKTGIILSEFPYAPSKNMGKGLGKHIDELYKQKVEGGDYVWRTRKIGFFQAGSRLSVPEVINPATFQELSKFINMEEK